jgi:hypothetical protein
MADGFSRGLDADRFAAYGNAVVTQIVEWIGRIIVEVDQSL